jgi:hypothetical protein
MTTTFSTFKNMLETETGKSGTSFELVSKFTLGSNSDGINPLTEVTVLNVGSYSVTLPAGSFRKNSKGDFVYEGKIGGEQLEIRIVPGGSNSYTLNAEGSGANSIISSRPVPVGLEIGNDMGVGTAMLD